MITDIGGVTVRSQPVCVLQILSPNGTWRWVRHIDNRVVRSLYHSPLLVLAILPMISRCYNSRTTGLYKPTIHRVVQPPHDQSAYDRLGAFYFTMADDDVTLLPLAHSPMLKRVRIERRCLNEEAPLTEAWRKGRTISYGRVALKKGSENNTEEEVIGEIVVKHCN